MTKHLHTDYTITFHSTLTVKKPSEKTHDKRVSFGDKRISSAEDFGSESGKNFNYPGISSMILCQLNLLVNMVIVLSTHWFRWQQT